MLKIKIDIPENEAQTVCLVIVVLACIVGGLPVIAAIVGVIVCVAIAILLSILLIRLIERVHKEK